MATANFHSRYVRLVLKIFMAIFCSCFAQPALADLPSPTIPNGFAIQVKQERVTLDQLREIADLGFQYVRTGMWWDNVEFRQRGLMQWDSPIKRFVPDPSLTDPHHISFETFVKQARRAGLKILVTLYHGNILYTGEEIPVRNVDGEIEHQLPAPRTPEQIAAFANFAAATARHFSERHGRDNFIWSIWNEPNMDTDFPPKHDAAIFGDVLLASCRAIKKAVPGATVIGPDITVIQGHGEGEIDYDFIKTMLRHVNIFTCIDSFSFHPYRPTPPDSATEDYQKIWNIIYPYMLQAGRAVPITVDEWGYTSHSDRKAIEHPETRDPEIEQAALIARFFLVNMANNVPLMTWYEWQDDGDDPKEGEHGFGLVTLSGRKKPGVEAVKALMTTLHGMRFDRQLTDQACQSAQTRLYLFKPSNLLDRRPAVLALWSDKPGTGISLSEQALDEPGTRVLGQNLTFIKQDGRVYFALGPLPRYIAIKDKDGIDPLCTLPQHIN